jgi:type II secretory pathway component GspD/PulD (secretin)
MLIRLASLLASLTLAFFSLGTAAAADLVLEVIALRYRTVEQVLPVLQPLVAKPGTISGMQNRLVVRTTPANLSEIRRVLDAIDRQPRKLMITVRQDADAQRGAEGVEVAGTVRSGGARTGTTGALQGRAYSTQSLENDRTAQQVQVLEGSEAFIRVGLSVPVYDRRVVREVVGGRNVERSVDTIDYRDILTGFHVRPQVSGDIVTVEVSPQRDTPGQLGRGSANVHQLRTTVSGRLGEWLEIGGVVSGRSLESSGTVYRTDAARTENRRILLKVDEIP